MKTGRSIIISKGIFILPIMCFIISFGVLFIPSIPGWLFSIPIAMTGVIYFIHCLILYMTTNLTLEDDVYFIESGLINRNAVELPLDKKESISIHRNFSGVIFGYGTLVIRGTGTGVYILRYVKNPYLYLKGHTYFKLIKEK
jgi:uncharacterized membrane protein YdbT with pleckstrin-like domain